MFNDSSGYQKSTALETKINVVRNTFTLPESDYNLINVCKTKLLENKIMYKIGFFEIQDWEIDYIKSKLTKDELVFIRDPLTENNLEMAKGCQILSPFIYSKLEFN